MGSVKQPIDNRIADVVRRYWGYDTLRPLQSEAIAAALQGRDSLTVLPTGGGKSLCYQVPPVIHDRTAVVVSPLISLMKDQVDGLRACGYSAAALHSGLSAAERAEIGRGLDRGHYRLLFVAPERLAAPGFLDLLRAMEVRLFAIDEAHCISHWGHDFRPEYRQLAALRTCLPQASLHAFTATATKQVQQDIIRQLQLQDPTVLVGTFDRPNLVYRVVPRQDTTRQVAQIIHRHAGEAVIVYCMTRKDTESLAARLQGLGIHAQAYHAGMDPQQRQRTQEAFAAEALDVITATVAFGMGIDRSNVRCVIHANMPKTIEHYQQETGRAGRDGLDAECVLLYSAADTMRWRSLVERSATTSDSVVDVVAAQCELIEHMHRLASALCCRHRALSEYFGQDYPSDDCHACDVCLGEVEGLADATVISQKILSCVARVRESFGIRHIVGVLAGEDTEPIRRRGHHQLSTYGLLSGTSPNVLTHWIYQLVDQGLLDRTTGDRPILRLNAASWEVLRGRRPVRLRSPAAPAHRTPRASAESWEGVDRGLFERLREVRRELAQERQVPAFVVFSDAALRDMARRKPLTLQTFEEVHGVGAAKLKQFGRQFTAAIDHYCRRTPQDVENQPSGSDRGNQ